MYLLINSYLFMCGQLFIIYTLYYKLLNKVFTMGADDYQNYEGGQSNSDRKRDKYSDAVGNFSVKGNSDIEDGLVQNRWCTDFLMLIIFLVFLSSMGYLTYYGKMNGDVEKLVAPVDANFKMCGQSPGYEGHRYLFVTDFSVSSAGDIFKKAVCVDRCPTGAGEKVNCKPAGGVADCGAIKSFATRPVIRYCFPTEIPPD